MHIVIRSARGERETVVEVRAPGATVGDLLSAAGEDATGVDVDGRFVRADLSLAEARIVEGATVVPSEPHAPDYDDEAAEPGRWLSVVAGRLAGHRVPLHAAGSGLVGRAPTADLRLDADTVSDRHAEVTVARDGTVSIVDLGSANGTWIDGEVVHQSTTLPLGGHVRVGALVLRLDGPVPDDRPAGLGLPDGLLIPFNRPPRDALPAEPAPVAVPGPVGDAREAPRFNAAMLVAPVIMGGAMVALYNNPRFALFAVLTPLMAISNWISGRRQAKKDNVRSGAEQARELERFRGDLAALVSEERDRRHRRSPDLGEVVRRATAPSRWLWERTLRHDDALHLRIGTGNVPWTPALDVPREGPDPEAEADIERSALLADVPVEADLRGGGVVGLVGDRDAALAVARALLLQAAVHHGPADVQVTICTDRVGVEAWDWAKWLPHVRDTQGDGRWLASDRATADQMLEAVIEAEAARDDRGGLGRERVRGPVRLVVVDAPDVLEGRAAPVRRVLAGEGGPVAGIVIAPTEDRLPASTTTVVDLRSDLGDAEVRYPLERSRIPDVLTNALDLDTARRAARALARFEDPELATSTAALPDVVRLLPLLGLEDVSGERVASGWQAAGTDPAPAAPVGETETGPFVLDLASDGPHGLIGGTTGSGKSELLRSLVAGLAARLSPEHLVFVLVDYKGGSAFDVCADLPHTVGMVTDLDAHLGERALISLEAELDHRMRVFRESGAQDLPEYRRLGSPRGPMPRLVVVIDEFATMATELPDFLGALVGIAQRGRSLGVHLLLATQRPSGAVNANIKANTNLRIALRVQDTGDSADIIDRPDAAHLSGSTPGRAYVRRGATDVTLVQTALSTASAGASGPAVTVAPFEFGPRDVPAPRADEGDEGPSDLSRLVSACREAFVASGADAPRRPWLPMLETSVPLASLADPQPGAASGVAVAYGLADEPATQSRRVATWRPGQGHLGVFGMVGSGTTSTLRTVARGLVDGRGPADVHLYALDFGGGALAELLELPHTGAVVGASEGEAQHRLVRHLREEVTRRRDLTAAERESEPLTVLLADDLPAFLAEHDGIDGQELTDDLRRVLADGPAVGVVAAFTADRPGHVSTRVTGTLAQQLVLQQADPSDFSSIGMRERDLPSFVPGRAIASDSKLVVQIGHPATLAEDVPVALAAVAPEGRGPRRIGALSATVAAESLPAPALRGELLRLPVGVANDDLAPAWLELHPTDHVTIAGPPRSGKTATLKLLAGQLRQADPSVVLVGVAERSRSDLFGYPTLDACGSLSELADLLEVAAGNDRRWVFLIDDAPGVEDVGGALERVVKAARPGLHVIVAGRTGDLRGSYGHWTRGVRQSRTGLLLQPDLAADGELLSVRLPRRLPLSFPAGRGFLVQAGEHAVVQVAEPHREPPAGSL